jgi:hypothetical protein
VRTSILVWSTVSGAVIGIVVAAMLLGAAVLVTGGKPLARWAILGLSLVPVAGAVLGYLEGRLKAT